jgi:hypothetical protein
MKLTRSERTTIDRRAAAANAARAKAHAENAAAHFDWDAAITRLHAMLNNHNKQDRP